MQLHPCASTGGTKVVAVEASSLRIGWCVATSRPASTTNPITRLCSPWPPLHSRLCLFIHPDLSEPPNFTNFAFLSQTPEIRSVHRFEAARFVSKTPNYNGEGLDQKDFD